ncbi:hypothetical protein F2Q68_00014701 [Brassica cretica]|uniref:Uncharacterized protein n=1 Tax=Brassica cretica TaxID=69181 RepID=A0A8S9HKJ8_BRACR|nr:hypothetical protein F2Q68_00014701 [Brassica cretica]
MKTSPNPTDESSLDRRVLTRPTSPHSANESSLGRRVLTRPTSPHSADESSLDRQVLIRPTSRHSIDESSLDHRSLAVAHISLAVTRLGADRSLAVAHISVLAELTCRLSAEQPFTGSSLIIKHLFLILFESSSYSLRVLVSFIQAQIFLSSLDRTSTDESSLDRRVLTRSKSRHLTVLFESSPSGSSSA